MKSWWLSILAIGLSLPLFAQEEEADLWQDEPQALEEEDLLRRESRNQKPLDINTADLEAWLSLPGASIDFIQAVLSYRRTHTFQSIYELQILPGADIQWLRLVRNRLSCKSDRADIGVQKREILYRIKPDLVGRKGFKTQGTEQGFLGKTVQQYWRYRDFRGALDWGLSVEQDAGESWRFGPDHVGFFLRIKARRILQTAVFGDYQLNLGQGLLTRNTRQVISGAIGDGLVNWNGILPVASANEYLFNRGLAVEYRLGNWHFISAWSHRKIDGRQQSDGRFTLYQSGLHRSAAERLHRKRLREQKGMQRIAFQRATVHVGVNMLYNSLQAGQETSGVSVDYKLQNNLCYSYGEALLKPQSRWEAVHGFLVSLQAFDLHWRLQGAGQEKQLEWVRSQLTLNFPYRSKQTLTLRWVQERTFTPSYRLSIPAENASFMLMAPLPRFTGLRGVFRLAYEDELRDKSGNGETLKHIDRHRWYRARLALLLAENDNTKLEYRLEWLQHRSAEQKQRAHLHYLQVKHKGERGQVFFRYTLFQTGDYDTRLYAYENDHLYVYAVPLFYGQGQRISIVLQSGYKRLSASLKWALNMLPEATEKGSGPDAYSGKYLHQLSLQLRYAW